MQWRTLQLKMLRQPILPGISLILAVSAGCGMAVAQADFEKGYQTYQSYHGSDFDTVNLANGNLVLNIPLISYEQRGGLAPVVISIRSNSTTFQPNPPYENGPLDTKQHEVASGVIGAPWGQPHVSISPGGLSWKEERITTSSKTATGPEYLTRFVAIDESGATHSLAGGIANKAAGNVPGIMYSVDGSGLMLQPGTNLTGPVLVDRNGSAGGLVDTNGNTIQLKGQCAKPGGSGDYFDPSLPAWEVYAHGTASATSIVDSIGRVIPNPSYLPPVANYSCLVDLDASYHPARPDANGCETWQFPGQSGTPVSFLFCYAQIPVSANIPQPNGSQLIYQTINETWWVLTSVTLPNSTQWTFGYDMYGQVNKVTMPTGAMVQYTYQTRIACGNPPGEIPVSGVPVWPFSNVMSSRMVANRILTIPGNGNTASSTQTWTYSNLIGSGWGAGPPASGQPNTVVTPGGANAGTVSVLDPLQNLTIHTFTLQGAVAGSSVQGNSFCGPYETRTQYYQGPSPSTSAILKEVDTTYNSLGTDYANPTNFSNYIALGVLPATKKTTLTGSGGSVASEEDTTYDNTPTTALGTYQDFEGLTHPFSFGLLLSSTEYDWANGTLGAPLRSTQHTRQWQSNWQYYAANLIDLPYQDTVYCFGCTTPSSQTTYVYDESAYSGLPGLGNSTTVTHWLDGGTSPSTHTVYSAAGYGMPSKKIDAKGNITQYIWVLGSKALRRKS
jgi:YD repeat-containing protein